MQCSHQIYSIINSYQAPSAEALLLRLEHRLPLLSGGARDLPLQEWVKQAGLIPVDVIDLAMPHGLGALVASCTMEP